MKFPFTQLLQNLPSTVPFVGPETLERNDGRAFSVRLGANESAFGISPRAREAMCEEIDQLPKYNDPENYNLREALARTHGISVARITVGAGIDDLLGLVVRAFLEKGDSVVTSLGSYPTFTYHAVGYGGGLHFVPYKNGFNDLQALSDKATQTRAKLVFLANPDNPAGTYYSGREIQKFLDILPARSILILDEAYIDFAPEDAILPIGLDDPRVIRMRTFSKAHGLAGARIGYAIAAAEIVGAFEKIRLHFGVNRVAQAGALASLQDLEFIKGVVSCIAEGRREYEALAYEVGMTTFPSAANFVSFDTGHARRAKIILEGLAARDVFVRKSEKPPLDRCFRVTVGRASERKMFADRLREMIITEK